MDYWAWLRGLNLFQETIISKPKPLTKDERMQVARFRSLRDRIHEGPLYTVLGENVRVGKTGNTAAAHFDPFEGMPTYSQRYTRKRRRIPKLDTRPYGAPYPNHCCVLLTDIDESSQIFSQGTLVNT